MIAHYLPSLFSVLVIKPLMLLTLVLVVAFVIRKSSAARQHFLLALGIFSVVLLPVLHWLFPIIEWSVEPSASGMASSWLLVLGQSPVNLDGGLWASVLLGLYLVTALWLLLYLALGIAQINRDTRRMVVCVDADFSTILADLTYRLDIDQPVTIVMGEKVDSPYMWGFLRPVIALPIDANDWLEDCKRSVLIHELAHVARRDWLTSIGVRICCALFWFLPPIWVLASRLNHCAELACDDYVYRLQGKRAAYAETLLALSCTRETHSRANPILSLARRSPIFQRIQAVMDRHRARYPVTHQLSQYWMLALLAVLIPLASIQAVPKPAVVSAPLVIKTATIYEFPVDCADNPTDLCPVPHGTQPSIPPVVEITFPHDLIQRDATDVVINPDMESLRTIPIPSRINIGSTIPPKK